jgi:hypothetical protein
MLIVEELKTENLKLQTEEMEVHHHPHVEKKRFKEYFLEFIMIFLAVTLGFFAENIREYISDREKEHVYMNSILGNVHTDSAMITESIEGLQFNKKAIDTLMQLIRSGEYKEKPQILYRLAYQTRGPQLFKYSNVTFEEMKSSGDFKLIRNKAVSNDIAQYDDFINTTIKELESRMLQTEKNQADEQSDILDDTVYPSVDSIIYHHALWLDFYKSGNSASLIRQDQQAQFLKLYNLLFERRVILDYYELQLGKLKELNKQLHASLKNGYNLSEE